MVFAASRTAVIHGDGDARQNLNVKLPLSTFILHVFSSAYKTTFPID